MNPIGIMQGRLSPPTDGKIQSFPIDSWEEEFVIAQECGLEFIEWVFDVESYAETPLLRRDQFQRILSIISSTGVKIGAVCADYFRDQPLIRLAKSTLAERLKVLEKLAHACARTAIPTIMIPFVDHSAINNSTEFSEAIEALGESCRIVRDYGLQLSLETNLEPAWYRKLIEDVGDPSLKVNYDLGDCVSLGHDTTKEIKLLAEWIVGVHVKDRKRGGGTVPLGTGDVDFDESFKSLSSIGYTGPVTLQTARGGNEVELAMRNLEFVKSLLRANHKKESAESHGR